MSAAAPTSDFFNRISIANNSLRSIAITVGANSNQEIAAKHGAMPLVTFVTLRATINGTVQFKSGAAGNAGAAVAITGAYPVATTDAAPFQLSNNGTPVLKGISMGDSIYVVTAGGCAVVGHVMIWEAQK